MTLPTPTRAELLFVGKAVVAAVAVGLSVSGHLSPALEHVFEVLLGSLGLNALAQVVAEGKASS